MKHLITIQTISTQIVRIMFLIENKRFLTDS